MLNPTLHIATAYSNPMRWNARRNLFVDYRQHVESHTNAKLYVAEAAFGDRPHEAALPNHPRDLQLRTRHELWHKENLLNLAIQKFDPDWEYGCYIDGDFHFTRVDWVEETIHALQHYDFAQMFSTYTDVDNLHRPVSTAPGFVYALHHKLDVKGRALNAYGRPGAPGGCWAFRRSAFNKVGGLLDTCVLGSADFHMSIGLAQLPVSHPDTDKCGPAYAKSIRIWQERAKVINTNIGYVDCHAIHHWHGPKFMRGYEWRWQILRDHAYDPATDIYRDGQGLWQLSPNKPKLRDDIRRYMDSRVEDQVNGRYERAELRR